MLVDRVWSTQLPVYPQPSHFARLSSNNSREKRNEAYVDGWLDTLAGYDA